MKRSAILFVMLFAMLWQALALARVGSTAKVLADPAHTALHWQEESHHHHDDGSYHLDDSNDSAQHMVSDHASTTAALMVAVSNHFLASGSTAPRSVHATAVPDPTLDGLLRPPRSHS